MNKSIQFWAGILITVAGLVLFAFSIMSPYVNDAYVKSIGISYAEGSSPAFFVKYLSAWLAGGEVQIVPYYIYYTAFAISVVLIYIGLISSFYRNESPIRKIFNRDYWINFESVSIGNPKTKLKVVKKRVKQ